MQTPEKAIPIQSRLDSAGKRIDQAIASALADYDDARKNLADHHRKMEGAAAEHDAAADALRKKLEPVVFGGQKPGKSFAKDCAAYQEAVAGAGQARLARRMCYPATEAPGTIPTGQPLGTPFRPEGESPDT